MFELGNLFRILLINFLYAEKIVFTPFYISNADYFYKKLNIVYINNLNTNNKII